MTTTTEPSTVNIHRADATRDQPVPPVVIAIDLTQPVHGGGYEAEARALFADDAHRLADALYAALPGGTFDALLGELLARKACLLRVPMPSGGAR